MFCSKCHTELDENAKFCKRCGTKVNPKENKSSWGSFSSTKTFERMNIDTINKEVEKELEDQEQQEEKKEEIEQLEQLDDHNEEHQKQYTYSKNYSQVKEDKAKEHNEQYSYSENYSNATQQQVTSDQDYIDAYIGNKSIFLLPFSIPAAIFGPFYFLYKKLWSPAIILIITYIATHIYLEEELGMLVRLVLTIILSFNFNKIYLADAERKVNIIKSRNQNATSNELLEECKRKGKPLGIGMIIVIIILYFTSTTALLVNDTEKIEEKPKETNTEYTIGNIHYKVPTSMQEKENYAYYQFFTERNDKGTCYVSMYYQKSPLSEKDYFAGLSTTYGDYEQTGIEQKTIKNTTWSYKTFDNSNTKKQVYVMKEKNTSQLYEIDFDEIPSNSNSCEDTLNYIIESMEIK